MTRFWLDQKNCVVSSLHVLHEKCIFYQCSRQVLHNFCKSPFFPICKTTCVNTVVTWSFIGILCAWKYYECAQYIMDGTNLSDDDLWRVVPFNQMTVTYDHRLWTRNKPNVYHCTSFPGIYKFLEPCEIDSSQTSRFSCVTQLLFSCFLSDSGLATQPVSPLLILVV